MTFDAINPVRSFPAAYALFVVMPGLMFASVVALSWLTLQVAPAFPPLAFISAVFQCLLGQVLVLIGAGLPAWHWFRHLRQSPRKWSRITIAVVALAHYFLMQWWCWLGYDALREYASNVV
jgi:hypothetical protein